MSERSDRDKAIDALVEHSIQQELLEEGRAALQAQDRARRGRGGGGGYRGGEAGEIDPSPGGSGPAS